MQKSTFVSHQKRCIEFPNPGRYGMVEIGAYSILLLDQILESDILILALFNLLYCPATLSILCNFLHSFPFDLWPAKTAPSLLRLNLSACMHILAAEDPAEDHGQRSSSEVFSYPVCQFLNCQSGQAQPKPQPHLRQFQLQPHLVQNTAHSCRVPTIEPPKPTPSHQREPTFKRFQEYNCVYIQSLPSLILRYLACTKYHESVYLKSRIRRGCSYIFRGVVRGIDVFFSLRGVRICSLQDRHSHGTNLSIYENQFMTTM